MSQEPSPGGERPGAKPRRALAWFGWWVGLQVLWLVLVGTLDASELVLGAAAAALGATAAVVVLLPGVDRFDGSARWLLRAWRLPWQAVTDTGRLTGALWRRLVRREPVHGGFRVLPFAYGGPDSRAVARRAAAKAAGSFAPNTYVVGIDEQRDEVLYHELVRADGRTGCDPLELG